MGLSPRRRRNPSESNGAGTPSFRAERSVVAQCPRRRPAVDCIATRLRAARADRRATTPPKRPPQAQTRLRLSEKVFSLSATDGVVLGARRTVGSLIVPTRYCTNRTIERQQPSPTIQPCIANSQNKSSLWMCQVSLMAHRVNIPANTERARSASDRYLLAFRCRAGLSAADRIRVSRLVNGRHTVAKTLTAAYPLSLQGLASKKRLAGANRHPAQNAGGSAERNLMQRRIGFYFSIKTRRWVNLAVFPVCLI